MFNKNTNPTTMQDEIARLLEELKKNDPSTDAYARVTDQLEQLYKIANSEKSHRRVSPDALAAALTSIGGIIAILGFEHTGVITSKALGFVTKSKF